MRYAVWTVNSCPEQVAESESFLRVVGESVRCFSDTDHYSFPITLRLYALRADGMPDRRYRPVDFGIDHDMRVVCHAETILGLFVRVAANYWKANMKIL